MHSRNTHSAVTGQLGDFLSPFFTFPLQLLEVGDDRPQKLDYDGSGNVGHNPQGENRCFAESAAGEHVIESEKCILLHFKELSQSGGVHSGNGDMTAQPDDDEYSQGEENSFFQFRNAEDRLEAFNHIITTSPPAASIFAFAEAETALTVIFNGLSISPFPRSLTGIEAFLIMP